MQLDKTRIVVRERNYMDLLDLALCVVRAHFWQLLLAAAVGAVPMILFNLWLVGDRLTDLDVELGTDVFSFVWTLVLLFLLEAPLAAAPITLYLGQALFQENPSPRKIAAYLAGSLPQMTIFQIGPRALLVLPAVLSQEDAMLYLCSVFLVCLVLLCYAFWPYLGEVILLERNPLFRKSRGGLSTLGRSINLHARNAGDLLGHWILSMILGGSWIVGLWLALDFVVSTLTGSADLGAVFYTVHFQIVVWTVVGFFTVVRFLSYLDLRIKNEGWEIELRMRAEAARLTRPLA